MIRVHVLVQCDAVGCGRSTLAIAADNCGHVGRAEFPLDERCQPTGWVDHGSRQLCPDHAKEQPSQQAGLFNCGVCGGAIGFDEQRWEIRVRGLPMHAHLRCCDEDGQPNAKEER